MLTVRAGHESESDPQRGPLVLQQLHDAVGVEDVAAGKLGAVLNAELLRVADCAKLVLVFTLVDTRCLCVVGFRAWCAFGFDLFNFFGGDDLWAHVCDDFGLFDALGSSF